MTSHLYLAALDKVDVEACGRKVGAGAVRGGCEGGGGRVVGKEEEVCRALRVMVEGGRGRRALLVTSAMFLGLLRRLGEASRARGAAKA